MTTIKSKVNYNEDLQRLIALAVHLGENCNNITPTKYDPCSFEVGGGKYPDEYLVLTDKEADTRAYEYVMSVWEECYLPELPKDNFLMGYIDLDAATKDAIAIDGRGHSLSSYDGSEEEVYFQDIDQIFYIYRTN